MDRTIRIGTRDSQLALWQANTVRELLEKEGYRAELVLIKSEGDLDLVTPLYELGVQGIFTRSLDIALLKNQIDLAVHSMKDVPTALPEFGGHDLHDLETLDAFRMSRRSEMIGEMR